MSQNPYEASKEPAGRKRQWLTLVCVAAAILLTALIFLIWLDLTISRQFRDFYFPEAAP